MRFNVKTIRPTCVFPGRNIIAPPLKCDAHAFKIQATVMNSKARLSVIIASKRNDLTYYKVFGLFIEEEFWTL